MGLTAAVAGASGYAGGELLRLLLAHPALELGPVAAGSHAGRPVTELHPHLPALAGRSFGSVDELEADVVFLALPHGESAAVAAGLRPQTAVVDLAADHRLADPGDWAGGYPGPHAGSWPYGLPELPGRRAVLRDARRIANPGCYPTAVALAVAPLLAAGLVEPDVVVTAASGTSGAGHTPRRSLLGSEVMGDVSAYKAGGTHQHIPEMRQTLSAAAEAPVRVSFVPLLAPMPRGILASCSAPLAGTAATADVREVLAAAYADEPFVHLLAQDAWPRTAATAGSNACHLQAAVDAAAGRVVVVAAIDNLGKGAAGQALQNANLALGLPEGAGLSRAGVAP